MACVIGRRCERHDFIHGAEAEELREALERFAQTHDGGEAHWARRILDKVDARDSLAYVETRLPCFPCAGFESCSALVDDEDGVCQRCQDRNDSENAGGCPGCGGNCVTACR